MEAIQSMLIFVSMLCGHRFSVDFHGQKCTLHDPHGQTIEVMKKAGENLFRLPLTSRNSQKRYRKFETKIDKYAELPNKENNGAVAMFAKMMSENI